MMSFFCHDENVRIDNWRVIQYNIISGQETASLEECGVIYDS